MEVVLKKDDLFLKTSKTEKKVKIVTLLKDQNLRQGRTSKKFLNYFKEFLKISEDGLFLRGGEKIYLLRFSFPDFSENLSLRKFRREVRKLVRELKAKKISQLDWYVENIISQSKEKDLIFSEIVKNAILADYDFEQYRTEKQTKIKKLNLYLKNPKKFKSLLSEALIVVESVNFVRDLANTPGSEMTPQKLAQIAKKELSKLPFVKVEIFDKRKIQKEKMGGVLGVSRGSKEEPKFIIVKYIPKKEKKIDLVIVGKGVTFDSGGLNIKPAEGMSDMYMDMSGGAAVLGILRAAALMKIPLNVIGLVPAVENMPSSESYRPGDLLKIYNKKTVEVLNTDAEGRIILADALSYGVKNFKPKLIIDIATLTGASMVALGQRISALFSNNSSFSFLEKLEKISQEAGDYFWPLPLWEEHQEDIKGTFGDIINIGRTRYGGAISGAAFLYNFIDPKITWIHLDIAPRMSSIDSDNLAKGATGAGTQFVLELMKNFDKLWK